MNRSLESENNPKGVKAIASKQMKNGVLDIENKKPPNKILKIKHIVIDNATTLSGNNLA